LILLGKLRRLDIVEALAPSVAVPDSVLREVGAGLSKDEAGSATLDWASARHVADVPLPVSITSWDLGAGESQVIAHCLSGAQALAAIGMDPAFAQFTDPPRLNELLTTRSGSE